MAKAEFVVLHSIPRLESEGYCRSYVGAEKFILLLLRALARWQEIH